MSYLAHAFEGTVDILDYDRFVYTVIYLPAELEAVLPFDAHPRLRVEGEINEHPFSGAFIPSEHGRHLILGAARLKAMDIKVGSPVEVRFNIADQDGVDIPDALQDALDRDPAALSAWQALTPGRQRGLAHLVGSAKSPATREKRATETVLGLVGAPGGRLPTQPKKSKR